MFKTLLLSPIIKPVAKGLLRRFFGGAVPTATGAPLTVDLLSGVRTVTFTGQTGAIDIRWGGSAPTVSNRIRIVTGAGSLDVGCPVGTTQMTVQAVADDVVLDYTETTDQTDYIKPMAYYGMADDDVDFVDATNIAEDPATFKVAVGALYYNEEDTGGGRYMAALVGGGNDRVSILRNNAEKYRFDVNNSGTSINTTHSTAFTTPFLDSVMGFSDGVTDHNFYSFEMGGVEAYNDDATGCWPDNFSVGFRVQRNPWDPSSGDYSDAGYGVYGYAFAEGYDEIGSAPCANVMTQYPGKAFAGFNCLICIAWDEDLGPLDITGRGATVAENGTVTTAVQSSLSELSSMVNPNVVESEQHVAVSYNATGVLTALPAHEGIFHVYTPDAIDTALEWYDSTDTLIPVTGTLTLGAGTTVRLFAPWHAVKVKLQATNTGTADFSAITS